MAGEHRTVETAVVEVTVTDPPEPDKEVGCPLGITARTLLTGSDKVARVPVVESLTVRVATTPDPIGVEFMPDARHVTFPVPVLQLTAFPAAVRAAPADVVIEVTSLVGNETTHCKAAGAEAPVKDKFREMEPPRTTDAEPRVKVCP